MSMPVVVVFDERLKAHGGVTLADNVVPHSPGDALVVSNASTPLAAVVSGAKAKASALAAPRELRIFCHAYLGASAFPGGGRVGGQGLELGTENLDQSNLPIVADWKGVFTRIWLIGCAVAYDESTVQGVRSTGRAFCANFAKAAQTALIASVDEQKYSVSPVDFSDKVAKLIGRPFTGDVDFGPYEGSWLIFDPVTGIPKMFDPNTEAPVPTLGRGP
jgi:hypothetical protein